MTDGREVKGHAMRVRLRAAAESLIAETGMETATTVEIARRCGVSRGAMLHHYPRRNDIIIDTAWHVWDRARDVTSRLADDMVEGRLSLREFISRMYEEVFPQRSMLIMLELLVAGRSDTELGRAVSEILTDLFRFYEKFCTRAFAARGASPEQIRSVVTLVVSTLRGLRVQHIADPGNTDVQAVQVVLLGVIEHLMGVDTPRTKGPAKRKRT